jgi:hypothetical protein
MGFKPLSLTEETITQARGPTLRKQTPYLGTLMDQTANPMSLQELRHSDNIKSFK